MYCSYLELLLRLKYRIQAKVFKSEKALKYLLNIQKQSPIKLN